MSILLAGGVCLAAYGFLSVYALNGIHRDELAAQQRQLRLLEQQRSEWTRKQAILEEVGLFAQQARDLGLAREDWTFYDVNVQAPLAFDTAQEIIRQCEDSGIAYFWPIALEVKTMAAEQGSAAVKQGPAGSRADVQLSVKGRFVARIQ